MTLRAQKIGSITIRAESVNDKNHTKSDPKKSAFSWRVALIYMCVLISGIGLIHISKNVRDAEREYKKLEREIESEQSLMRVLEAEWAYLNAPDRLEALAAKYLFFDNKNTLQITGGMPESMPIINEEDLNSAAPELYRQVSTSSPPTPPRKPVNLKPVSIKPAAAGTKKPASSQQKTSTQPERIGRKPKPSRQSFNDLLQKLNNGAPQDQGQTP